MMVSLRAVLLALTLVVARAAANPSTAQQNLTTYVPDCAQNCLEQSLSGVCSGPDDAECLCDNFATIGPGSRSCVIGACSGNTTEQNAARSGYVKYCSDTGHPVEGGGQFWPGWSSGSGGWQTSTTMGTSTTSPSTSPSTSTAAPPPVATAASESEGGGGNDDGGSDLSKGAIAGIAVGGGIACILVTGGLLFIAFRLGRRHYQRKHEGGGGGGGGSSSPQGPNPPEQGEEEAATDLQQKEDGARTPRRTTNAQLDGNPVSELHAGIVDSGLDPIKELPTHERPAELSADPISYDSPVLPQSTWR